MLFQGLESGLVTVILIVFKKTIKMTVTKPPLNFLSSPKVNMAMSTKAGAASVPMT